MNPIASQFGNNLPPTYFGSHPVMKEFFVEYARGKDMLIRKAIRILFPEYKDLAVDYIASLYAYDVELIASPSIFDGKMYGVLKRISTDNSIDLDKLVIEGGN